MPQTALKTLIEQGKVMLPAELPQDQIIPPSTRTKESKIEDSGSVPTLLDMPSPNAIKMSLYPVLIPDSSSGIGPQRQSSGTTHSLTNQPPAAQSSERLVSAEKSTATPKSYRRTSRQLDGQQSGDPPKPLSPIHEEQMEDCNLVRSAPLFAVNDNQLEPLTPFLSNESMGYTRPYRLPDVLQTNPLHVPQFYPQQQPPRKTIRGTPQPFATKPYKAKDSSYTMAPSQPSNLSPTKYSHRHPSYNRLRSSEVEIPPGHVTESLLLPPHFSYNRPYILTNCSLRSCNAPTTSVNVSTCMCPLCGPFSVVRYCSVAHLHADLLRHYTEDCGRRSNMFPLIAVGTVEPFTQPARPFISVARSQDESLERHRQAVYWSYPTFPAADYYIFDDADLLIAGEQEGFVPSPAVMRKYRGRGAVIATVTMRNNSVVKAQFAGTLEKILAMGVAAGRNVPDKCRMIFNWIKVYLDGENRWNQEMMNRVALAMQLEFGYKVPLNLFGH